MKIVQNRFSSIYSNDKSALKSDLYPNGIKEFIHSFPVIHEKSAFGKIPIEKGDNSQTIFTDTDKIKTFEDENEAFLWYKKNYYKNLLENDKLEEEKLCKNYFIIEEKDIAKYYKYFNGMVKSLSVDINLDIYFERSDTNNECDGENPPDSSSSSSDDGDDGGGSGSGSTLSVKNLKEVLFDIKEYKILETETEEGFVNANFQININTDKIFEDENLEERMPANADIFRRIGPSYGYAYEEGENIDTLTILSTEIGSANLYENEWEFSEEEFKKPFTKDPTNFPRNSVLVNDPIILNSFNPFKKSLSSLRVSFEQQASLSKCDEEESSSSSSSSTPPISSSSSSEEPSSSSSEPEEPSSSSSGGDPSPGGINVEDFKGITKSLFGEHIEKLKHKNIIKILEDNENNYYFDNNNFGFYSVNVSKSCTEAVSDIGINFDFTLRDILYVKPEKKYLCFIEVEVDVTYDIRRSVPFNSDFNILTTREDSKIDKRGLALQSSSGSSEDDEGLDYIKEKFSIYLDNSENPLEIEVHALPSEYSIDSEDEGNCYTGNRSLKIFKNNLNFKINTWKDEDFGPKIFPPKIES
jgi:hypothetical protein